MNYTGYPSIDQRHNDTANFFEKHPLIPDISYYNLLSLISHNFLNYSAISCFDDTITFKNLMNDAKKISMSLIELGIKKNDIVVINMPNNIQDVVLYLACNRIGAIVTFLNAKSTIEEQAYYLNLFESPLLINFNELPQNNIFLKNNTKLKQIVTLKNFKYDILLSKNNKLGYSDYLSFEDFSSLSTYQPFTCPPVIGNNSDSLILYTSGSTGNPKAVVLTNQNIVASAIYMKNSVHLSNDKGEKSLVIVPFNYPYGFITSTLMSLLCGRETILAPDINSKNINKYLEKNPNYIFGIPPFYNSMISNQNVANMDLSSVKVAISGGDIITEDSILKIIKFFKEHNSNALLYNGSGNAETGGANTNAVGHMLNLTTVGKPLVGTKVTAFNKETMQELKYGEEGILAISGKHVFKEYYNDKESTENSFHIDKNGIKWYLTDTYVILSEDGYMQIVGRDRRFFITYDEVGQPFKVYCNYVQETIEKIEGVSKCAVLGMDDSIRNKVPVAYVVLDDNIKITNTAKENIMNNILTNNKSIKLKSYEIPVDITIIDDLPYTDADKVDYGLLENMSQSSSNISVKVKLKEKK